MYIHVCSCTCDFKGTPELQQSEAVILEVNEHHNFLNAKLKNDKQVGLGYGAGKCFDVSVRRLKQRRLRWSFVH